MLLLLLALSITFCNAERQSNRRGGAGIDWVSLHCPRDNVSTLPTPTYGTKERAWMICTEIIINAPAQNIYDTLIDFNNYYLWNSFVVDVQVPPGLETPDDVYVGMQMVFTTAGLIQGVNTTSDEQVTVLDDDSSKHYLLTAWRFSGLINGTLSRAEHPSILTNAGSGKTRLVSYETYYEGPVTELILPLKPQLQVEFDQQGQDLKRYMESL